MKLKLLLALTLACSSAFSQSERIEGWKKDIAFLEKELPAKHVDFFAVKSKEHFRGELKAISASLGSQSDIAIAMRLQQLVAEFGDSHTGISWRGFLDKAKIYGLWLFWFKDGIYATGASPGNEPLLGKRIVSLNGKPLQVYVDSLTTLFTPDNFSQVKKEIPQLLCYSQVLDYFQLLDNNEFFVEAVDPVTNDLIRHKVLYGPVDAKMTELPRDSIPFNVRNSTVMFTDAFFSQDSIYRIQYNRCWSKELEERYNKGKDADKYPSFLEFHNRVLHSIVEKPVKKIVFDLRFNPGGSSPQGSSLIEAISKLDKVRNGLPIYVLIGRYTFSSAVINAMNFKRFTKAIFVGEATSGKPNHFGNINSFILKNTGTKVVYSTKYIRCSETDESALFPDVEILTSIEDYRHGIEPAIEWIRKQ